MTVGELVAYLKLDDRGFNRGLDEGERKFSGFGSRVGGIASSVGKVAMGAAMGGIAALGAGLVAGGVAGMKYNSSIEQTTIAMGTMLGSTDKATKLINDVAKMAASTPFEFPELADATKRLVAYGVAAQDAVPLMTRLGDVSSALGVPIGELADIYGKMKVSGKITMEDVNEMAGRGIPIYDALAKVLGVGKDQVRGLVESGKVGFPDVEKAMKSMTDKGSMFGGMMDKQSRSFSGLWSTVKDGIVAAFGKALMPAFEWLVKTGMPAVVEAMPKIQAAIGTAFSAAGKAVGVLVDVSGFLVRHGDTVKTIVLAIAAGFVAYQAIMLTLRAAAAAYTAVQWLLNAAMTANPVGLIVVGIAALVAGFVVLWTKCSWFRDFWIAVWGVVKAEFALVWPVVKAIIGFIVDGLQAAWTAISTAVSAFWDWAGPYITQAVQVWWTVISTVVGTIIDVISTAWDWIKPKITAFWDWASPYIQTAIGLWWQNIKTTFDVIVEVFRAAWQVISGIVSAGVTAVKTAIDVIGDVVAVVRGVWNRIKSGAETVWDAIVGVVRDAIGGVKKVVDTVGDVVAVVRGVWNRIKSGAETVWDAIVGVVRDAIGGVKKVVDTVGDIIEKLRAVWEAVKTKAGEWWDRITGVVSGALTTIKGLPGEWQEKIVGAVGDVWTAIKKAAKEPWDAIVGVVSGAFGKIRDYANDIIGVINWVIDHVPGLKGNVGHVPTFGGGSGQSTGGTQSSTSSSGGVSTPAVMDNGGMGGPGDDTAGKGSVLGSVGDALGSAAGWVGDLVSKYNIFDKLPAPVGGLFGGATDGLLAMGKEAIVGLLKKFGLGDRQKIVDFALSMLGVPYLWGGTSPAGFDCSGLIYWAYRQAGIESFPRIPTYGGRQIGSGEMQPADVLFYYPGAIQNGVRVPFGHFKMYAGNNETVESTSGGVQTRPLDSGYAQIRTYLARGGITNGLAIAGEAGPEAVIPLTNPQRGAAVMREAGLLPGGGDTVVQVTFSGPVYATSLRQAQDTGDAIAVAAITKLATVHRRNRGRG
jgi:tape measure domain-containing protein